MIELSKRGSLLLIEEHVRNLVTSGASEEVSAGFTLDDILDAGYDGAYLRIKTDNWELTHLISSWNIRELKSAQEYFKQIILQSMEGVEINKEQDGFMPDAIAFIDIDKSCSHKKAIVELVQTFINESDYYLETARDGGSVEVVVFSQALLDALENYITSHANT